MKTGEHICKHCALNIKDFHGDKVWRDADGRITCSGVIGPGEQFHEPLETGKNRPKRP